MALSGGQDNPMDYRVGRHQRVADYLGLKCKVVVVSVMVFLRRTGTVVLHELYFGNLCGRQ